jgi:hypothetical protein
MVQAAAAAASQAPLLPNGNSGRPGLPHSAIRASCSGTMVMGSHLLLLGWSVRAQGQDLLPQRWAVDVLDLLHREWSVAATTLTHNSFGLHSGDGVRGLRA